MFLCLRYRNHTRIDRSSGLALNAQIEISSIDKFMFVGGTQIKQQDANNFAFALLCISIIDDIVIISIWAMHEEQVIPY